MTAIAAVWDQRSGKIVMGGDSALTDDDFHQLSMAETKVFRAGEFLIGGSGSARGGQLMRFRFAAPKRPAKMDPDEYMATHWIDELRRVFKAGGHTYSEHEGGEESSTANALIGYRGQVWVMYGADFQIERVRGNYLAIGSGAPYALGSLHTTQADGATRDRIERALDAACAHSAACAKPYTILTLAKEHGGTK